MGGGGEGRGPSLTQGTAGEVWVLQLGQVDVFIFSTDLVSTLTLFSVVLLNIPVLSQNMVISSQDMGKLSLRGLKISPHLFCLLSQDKAAKTPHFVLFGHMCVCPLAT